jgi:tripartite-type tricarboxylate transporter receptor subunit TctC
MSRLRDRVSPSRKRRNVYVGLAAAVALTTLTACSGGGTAAEGGDDADTFYQGKTVEIIVPYGPGGSNDAAARFLAPLLSKYVPGEPRVQVINVEGGATVTGSNQFERAPHDGLTWFMGGSNVTFQDIFENPNADYKLADWTPLAGFPQGQIAYASTSLGIESADELLDAKEPIVLSTQDTEGASLIHVLALQILGVDFKIVSGYADTGAKRVALLTGEVNVNGESTIGYLQYDQPEVDDGNAIPLYSFGFPNADGGLDRDPAAPDIPTLAEVYENIYGTAPSGPMWDLYLGLANANSSIQKSFYIHADAPAAAIEALQTGLKEMQDDPDYLDGVENVLEGYQPVFGDDLLTQFETLANPSDAFAKDAIQYRTDITDAVNSNGGQIKGFTS